MDRPNRHALQKPNRAACGPYGKPLTVARTERRRGNVWIFHYLLGGDRRPHRVGHRPQQPRLAPPGLGRLPGPSSAGGPGRRDLAWPAGRGEIDAEEYDLTVRSSRVLKERGHHWCVPRRRSWARGYRTGQGSRFTVTRYWPYLGSRCPVQGSGIWFGRRAKDVPRGQDVGFRFRAVNPCTLPAALGVASRLPRGLRGSDQAGLSSLSHERRRALRPVPLWRSP